MNEISEIAALLRERLPDVPVHETTESGPYHEGINLWRLTRADLPTRYSPYRGTFVRAMYAPQAASEQAHSEWARRMREVLLAAYPDRYRPMQGRVEGSGMLIEDPGTDYTQRRAADNAKRAQLGWAPLHEIGH